MSTAAMTRAGSAAEAPPILLGETEADALFALATARRGATSLSAELLLHELGRASVMPAEALPADVVTMGSHVVFLDRASGERHSVELVYPADADMACGRVSILTPVGAALIGMRRGSAIDWPNRQGERRRLEIVDVTQPPRGPRPPQM